MISISRFFTLLLIIFTIKAYADEHSGTAFREYKANYIIYSHDGGGNGKGEPNSACDFKVQFSFIKPLKTEFISEPVSEVFGKGVVDIFGTFNLSYTQKSFWDICRSS